MKNTLKRNNLKKRILAGMLTAICVTSVGTMCIGSAYAAENTGAIVNASSNAANSQDLVKSVVSSALNKIGGVLDDTIPGFFLVKDYALDAAKYLLGLEEEKTESEAEKKLEEISSKLDDIKHHLDQRFAKVLAGIYKLDSLKNAETAVNTLSTLNGQVTVRVKSELKYIAERLSKGEKITEEEELRILKKIADINGTDISSATYSYAINNLYQYINGENIESCMSGSSSAFDGYFKYMKMNSTHGSISEDSRKFAGLILQNYATATYYSVLSYAAQLKYAQATDDLSSAIEAKVNIEQTMTKLDNVVAKYKSLFEKTENIYTANVEYDNGENSNYYNSAAAFDEAIRSGKKCIIKLYKDWKMEKVDEEKKESIAIPDLDNVDIANRDIVIDLNGKTIECVNTTANAFNIKDSTVTIKNGTIKNGIIAINAQNSKVTLENIRIENNTTNKADTIGVYAEKSVLTINNSEINGRHCGISEKNSSISLDCVTVKNSKNEGILLNYNSSPLSFKANNCTFSHNGSYAIKLNGGHNMDMKYCVFENNKGKEGGAVNVGMNLSYNEVKFTNCTFKNNQSESHGGAVNVHYYNSGSSSKKIQFSSCDFTGNSSKGKGGAIYGINLSLFNCKFNSNKSDGNGGAVFLTTNETVKYCDFTNNTSGGNGGAVSSDIDNNFLYCTFISNKASNNGGAIYLPPRVKIVIRGCSIKENSAKIGGGLWLGNLMSTWHELYECTITGNRATQTAGGIFTEVTTLDGCADLIFGGTMTVTGNTANGCSSNVYLNKNWCQKCLIATDSNCPLTSSSRIGISSPYSGSWLDVVRVSTKDIYENLQNTFSSDSSAYSIKRYVGKGSYYWYYIDHN